ncbi:uncharacterized protein G2W53_015545 [Senna tora]|uniref:Uncharacterized protein n=1 Tax=Senna tora TaxID=362788 RepID=A0A834WVQ4_9FABA|nr:uncharacterized protein G2W53_015545 [Senna tora]
MGSPYSNTFNYEETYQTNLSSGETNTRPLYGFQEGDFGLQKYQITHQMGSQVEQGTSYLYKN